MTDGIEEWFYFERNNRAGPISEEKLKDLFNQKKLTGNTQVWKAGLDGWIPLAKSGIAGIAATQMPPPISENLISNSIVWTIAFLPLVFLFANVVWLTLLCDPLSAQLYYETGKRLFGIIEQTVIYSVLCISDQRRLKKAGYDVDKLFPVAFVLPVYLFMRASALKQTPYYGFVWLVCFLVVMII